MRVVPKLVAAAVASALALLTAAAVVAAPPAGVGGPPLPVGGGKPAFAGGPPPGVGGGQPMFLTSDRVFGSGTVTDAFGTASGTVDAYADPDGSNPRGTVTMTATFAHGGDRTLVGDVSQGCVVVDGNLALVVGRIPEDQQWTVPVFGTVEYAAATVEDNGASLDRAYFVALRESSKQTACATGPSLYVSRLQPLDSGNFTVIDN